MIDEHRDPKGRLLGSCARCKFYDRRKCFSSLGFGGSSGGIKPGKSWPRHPDDGCKYFSLSWSNYVGRKQ